MARRSTRARRESVPDLSAEIKLDEIWITAEPPRPLRELLHVGRRARAVCSLIVACLAIAAALAVVFPGGNVGAHANAAARAAGPRGIAAAFEYPLGCLTTTLAGSDPQWARVRLYRGSPCWRYGVWETVVVRRLVGAWHVVFERSDYSCPVKSIPAAVQRELGVCPPEGP